MNVVKNAYRFSTVMIIYFSDSPKVQPFVFPSMVQIHEKTSVLCIVKQGTQPITFRWYKDNSEIQDSNNIKIKVMDDMSVLTIEPVSSSDSGNYTCSATNAYGKHRHSAQLTVEGKCKSEYEINFVYIKNLFTIKKIIISIKYIHILYFI